MVVPEALAPHRLVASSPISQDAASAFLTTYITHSESHAHLHPDALITPSGVKFSSAGGPLGGVIMHNLRRVAAGLRGEYLEAEATPEPEEKEGRKGVRTNIETADDYPLPETAEQGWQDKDQFEREQGVEEGDLGETNTFVRAGGDIPEVLPSGKRGLPVEDDKEARKRAKKERNKQFKLDKEKKKAATNED